MHPRLRSALTLTGLVALVLVASAWGLFALTRPLPQQEVVPVCTNTRVAAGAEVTPEQVAVSVFNASTRNGLASKTLGQLVTRGFVPASTGNAPQGTEVKGVQVWASDARNPAVALVAQHFRNARVVAGSNLGPGVVVVVGNGFKSLRPRKQAPQAVTAEANSVVCTPPDVLP
ncbi:LytR C-terminal domain-containing protein [Nocardioides solisilvae]|uniref:LytR C-terminal domain-containing protein n=1 Tax=Nocardioides solisilvae TaxID=1542435 RepID=UPI000D74EB67|nr:LytR C-terminal domain-containing protein [Nocardioides solisilvae]